jgi:hypothetical protein
MTGAGGADHVDPGDCRVFPPGFGAEETLDISKIYVHLMFMSDTNWKSSRDDRLRDLDTLVEMTLSMIRMLKASAGDAASGPKAKSFARDLRLLTRSLEATIALRDKIAASQAARDARAALEAAELSAAKADGERQWPRLVYSRQGDARAKSKDRGPPNG